MASMWTRIADDFRQKELLPMKLIFLINVSSMYVFFPYLTIHMRELGIAVEETAVMHAVTPFFSTITPPLTGLVADRIGNFKVLLCASSVVGGISSLLLLLVPAGRAYIAYPSRIALALSCNHEFPPLQASLLNETPCILKGDTDELTDIALESCGIVCEAPANLDLINVLSVPFYGVDIGGMKRRWFNASSADGKLMHLVDPSDPRLEKLDYPEDYYKAIRIIHDRHIYVPTENMYNVDCLRTKCSLPDITNNNATDWMSTDTLFRIKGETESIINTGMDESNTTKAHAKPNFDVKNKNTDSECEDPESRTNLVVEMPSIEVIMDSCQPLCLASTPRSQICSDVKKERVFDPSLTFWFYLGIMVFNTIITAATFTMFDGALIAILREYKADYGLQRIYATIGGMISAPLTGWLMDFASAGKQYTDFRPAFYLFTILKVIGGMLVLAIKLDFKAPAPGVAKKVLKVLREVEVAALIFACFLLGCTWGFLDTYLFWLLQDLGASRSLMGLTLTVGGLAGLPLLAQSSPIIKKIGHANIICIGFAFYTVRLIGYSLLYNPWASLIFEVMEGVTSGLTLTAVTTYAASLSNPEVDASMQGFVGGIHYGVGRGVGAMVGGLMIKSVGTRPTYQIFAFACAIFAVIYFLFHNCVTMKRPNRNINDITKSRISVDVQLECAKEEMENLNAANEDPKDGGKLGRQDSMPDQ